jgi:UDP-N-acetylmuramyl pentapeptide synthase
MLHRNGDELLMARIINCMVDILVIAGEGNRSQVKKELLKIKGRMATVGKQADRLHKAVGEEITTCNLRAESIVPDTRFDSTAMDDAYAEGLQRKEELIARQVLCTCALGLVRYVKVSKEAGLERMTLLKPKVVLDSLMEEMAKASN